MSTGISFPLVCDPTTKLEYWLFQRIGTAPAGPGGSSGQPTYRRLPYNLVSFDGDPTQYIEPDAASGDFFRTLEGTGQPIDPRTDGVGMVAGFLFFDKRPFEVFSYNDFDAATTGMLP
jgi:hypothetical protein